MRQWKQAQTRERLTLSEQERDRLMVPSSGTRIESMFATSISNTQVTFAGVTAPFMYVSGTQIDAATSFDLAPDSITRIH